MTFRLLVVIAFGFSVSALGCGHPEPPREGQPDELLGAPPAGLPKAPRELRGEASGYYGSVSDLGREWVELAPGWKAWGREANEKNNDKPKRISAAGTAPGGDPEVGGGSFGTYFLTDLRVGDRVDVAVGVMRDGREWAMSVLILRRPGGKIPPMPTDRFDWSEKNQAYQDWEERGTPIPTKYLRDGRTILWDDVSLTNPPYPPVAPMPREKK